jgi:hypothetical protein
MIIFSKRKFNELFQAVSLATHNMSIAADEIKKAMGIVAHNASTTTEEIRKTMEVIQEKESLLAQLLMDYAAESRVRKKLLEEEMKTMKHTPPSVYDGMF